MFQIIGNICSSPGCKCQQLFAVKLADASESIMPTSSLHLLQLRCNRAAQRIATELSSTRAAAVATSTGDDAPAQQVFCLLASRFVLLTSETSSATLCSGQVRRFPRDEAITFLLETSLCLEAPLPIREMITAATEMTRGNING